MTNITTPMAPTDAEIVALMGDSRYSTIGAVREAISRWGQPHPSGTAEFARAIEAEVRKEYTELIRQLVDALEQSQPYVESCANGKRVQWWGAQLDRAQDAINAARARLEQPCA